MNLKNSFFIIILVWIGALLTSACSNLDNQCIIKGQFTNLSEGELYFYMPEGSREKMDTVSIREGKFIYAIPNAHQEYSIMLFPNMSDQVIFVEPNLEIKIEANATQLKSIKIEGGKENKLMSEFRNATIDLSTQETQQKALDFILQNPTSLVSDYLLKKYLIEIDSPDFGLIDKALSALVTAQPQQIEYKNLQDEVKNISLVSPGHKAPNFTVTDYQGEVHKLTDYKGKDLLLIFGATWAESYREQIRNIRRELNDLDNKPEVVSIVLDQTKVLFRSVLRDTISKVTISDKTGWKSQIVKDYSIHTLPTFILIDKEQKIVAREDQWNEIKTRIN